MNLWKNDNKVMQENTNKHTSTCALSIIILRCNCQIAVIFNSSVRSFWVYHTLHHLCHTFFQILWRQGDVGNTRTVGNSGKISKAGNVGNASNVGSAGNTRRQVSNKGVTGKQVAFVMC